MRRNINAAEKLRSAHVKLAQARIILMDISQYTSQPHIKALADKALAIMNEPVDKYVGTRNK